MMATFSNAKATVKLMKVIVGSLNKAPVDPYKDAMAKIMLTEK